MPDRRRRSARRHRSTRWRRIACTVLAVGVCLGLLTVGTLWSLKGSALAAVTEWRPPFEGRPSANILVMGIDDGQGGLGRSDTMFLAHVDARTRQVTALSIPRDTRVSFGDGQFMKINAAHARGGPELAARAVSDLTGMPVNYTLRTDFAGFSRLVDLLGGIDLNVEQAMDYEDHWGGLSIHLRPGIQHLDGAKAIQYVRFRKSSSHQNACDGSDLSRIERQQKFVEAVAARCLMGGNMFYLPEIIREGRRQLQTDLATSDLLYLGGLVKEIGRAQLKVLTVPGRTAMIGGQSYWIADQQQLAELVRQLDTGPNRTEQASIRG